MRVSAALIGLSNSVHQGSGVENAQRREEIINALGLPPLR